MFKKSIALFSLSLISAAAFAAPAHYIVAPKCLLLKTQQQFETLATVNSLTFIKTDALGIEQLIAAKNQRSATPCGGFMDVSDAWNHYSATLSAKNAKTFLNAYAAPISKANATPTHYKVNYPEQVNQLIASMNPKDIWTDLTYLTNFKNRYADSKLGVRAANWIQGQVLTLAKDNHRTDVTSFFVKTTGYKQPSLVIKIGDSNEAGVVIGAHMDTLDSQVRLKPGADDDGSGTSSLLEVARTLLTSDMHFKKPIYLIWYAAEEEGLYGSQNVVQYFVRKKIPVAAVMQLDMTGYTYQSDPTIWLITDNTDKKLSTYLKTLIKTYVNVPASYTKCGYACSDHVSWEQAGFTASFPFEAPFEHYDPYIHSSKDTMDTISLDHMANFAKLGTAFAVELAEPMAG